MPKPSSRRASTSFSGHPISVVAERTGLSRDVLRVWERRYRAVEPARSSGGQRLYSNEQIARFRLLAAATSRGRNIGMVAELATAALERLVAEDEAELPSPPLPTPNTDHAEPAETALEHVRALDGSALDRELRRTIAHRGIPVFLEDVVPTLMRRVGDEWLAGRLTIAHEHLASSVVVALILESSRAVPESPASPRLLVATPAGERHAVGAALAAAAAALDGWAIVHLGVDLPAADIVAAATASGARAVAISVIHTDHVDDVVRELRAVRDALATDIPVVVGGPAAILMAAQLVAPGLTVCGSIADMRRVLPREKTSA